MAVENADPARPQDRSLPPRVLAPAAGIAVALSLAVLALWRFAPGLLPVFALLLACGTALLWGAATAARQQVRTVEEACRSLEEDLARSARDTQELEGYRKLFQGRPAEKKAALPEPVSLPDPPPSNVHSIIRDPLTGLFHRRYFEASLEREVHRMERRNLTLGVILMRIDQDEVPEALLRSIGALLLRRVRGGDVASRHDGGTFGLLLPEAPLEGVRSRAEQLCAAVRETGGTTLSLGVAAFPDCGHSPDRVLKAVKAALDDARAGGGDRVATAPVAVLDRRLMLPD